MANMSSDGMRLTIRRQQERGQTIVLVAIAVVTIIAMAALAIDVVTLYVARAEMQRAADGAALVGAKPDFRVHVEGTTRDLAPILRDETYRIAGEAVRNAFRHAQARRIEVEIQYGQRDFRLRV